MFVRCSLRPRIKGEVRQAEHRQKNKDTETDTDTEDSWREERGIERKDRQADRNKDGTDIQVQCRVSMLGGGSRSAPLDLEGRQVEAARVSISPV